MSAELVLDRHVQVRPGVRGGKPHIADTRITVDDVVIMHLRMGVSLEEIAGKYDLSPAAVHAALAYYYDHRDAIDQQIAQDETFVEAFRKDNPSLLREKLRRLNLD
ncbi:DUF433 domain-containing protein [Chloroflexi bacterium TSY]|nr:DUF433 domain-containing protein [Chloroflexi bacterium TSY]